jgi:hypothetical protein
LGFRLRRRKGHVLAPPFCEEISPPWAGRMPTLHGRDRRYARAKAPVSMKREITSRRAYLPDIGTSRMRLRLVNAHVGPTYVALGNSHAGKDPYGAPASCRLRGFGRNARAPFSAMSVSCQDPKAIATGRPHSSDHRPATETKRHSINTDRPAASSIRARQPLTTERHDPSDLRTGVRIRRGFERGPPGQGMANPQVRRAGQ